jgi:Ca-activated chloride channel family protein
MRFIYSKWDRALLTKLKQLRDLMAVFNYILLQVNGSVQRALKVMERLKELGYLPPDFDIDEFKEQLERDNIVDFGKRRPTLTPKGERGIRKDAFEYIFSNLRNSGDGAHQINLGGGDSEEILPEKREYGFGDDLKNLDLTGSLFRSISRTGSLGMDLNESDLEVYDSARTTSAATVILIDISHSMILYGEDRITPAKQVAMAFVEMILTKYPKDNLNIVTFGNDAKEVQIKDLPYISVGPFLTNTKAGLQMARQILFRRKNANKQIFMITDGKPSLIVRRNGRPYKNPIGLDPVIVNRTLDEAVICRKKKITITTFMIASDPYLQQFVERLTELNKGRAYFASPHDLGNYVFYDFLSHRRRQK